MQDPLLNVVTGQADIFIEVETADPAGIKRPSLAARAKCL